MAFMSTEQSDAMYQSRTYEQSVAFKRNDLRSQNARDVDDYFDLSEALANVSQNRKVFLKSVSYVCNNSKINLTGGPIDIQGSAGIIHSTALVSNNCTFIISSANTTFQNLMMKGYWTLWVSPNSSLSIRNTRLDRIFVEIGPYGHLEVQSVSVARQSASPTAFRIAAQRASILIKDMVLRDAFGGAMLTVDGPYLDVAILNASFVSADPNTGNLTSIPVTGMRFDVTDSNLSITSAALLWCGLRGLILNGSRSRLALVDSAFYQNTAADQGDEQMGGGALAVVGSGVSVLVQNCSMRGQWSDTGGGAIDFGADDGELRVIDSRLDANQAGGWGGAISFEGARGRLSVLGSSLSNNIVFGFDGGAVYFSSTQGRVQIGDSVFHDNEIYGNGGAMLLSCAGVEIFNSTFRGNVATAGGGLYLRAQEAAIRDSRFDSNFAGDLCGGGLYSGLCDNATCAASGTLNISNCSFLHNSAAAGGGACVEVPGSVVVLASAFRSNLAFGDGGGLLHQSPWGGGGPWGQLSVSGSVFSGNSAQGGGGGVTIANGAARLETTLFESNSAGGGGGGMSVAGYPYGAADGAWTVEGCRFEANRAGGSGGALLSDSLTSSLDVVATGLGVPFGLWRDLAVLCRGAGAYDDLDVVRFSPLSPGPAPEQSASNLTPAAVLLKTALVSGLQPDALVAGLSADGTVAVLYQNWNFSLVAVNVSSLQVLGRVAAPPVPAYTGENLGPGSLSDVLPVFIPKIVDTNYYWFYVYGGWGLSYAATGRLIFTSTFHHTVAFRVDDLSFSALAGCDGGVTAMTLSAGSDRLFLARYTGVGYQFELYGYSLADALCSPYQWNGTRLTFAPVRAMGASADGRTLYVAEKADWVDQLREYQAIKAVDLKSGAVTYFLSSPASYLLVDSIAALLPITAGNCTTIWILCAPGGWLGGLDGQSPIEWQLLRIESGRLQVRNTSFVANSAAASGGGIAALNSTNLEISGSSFDHNHAVEDGGGLLIGDTGILSVQSCNISNGMAGSGGGIFAIDNAQTTIVSSGFYQNHAVDCGGAIGIGGERSVSLLGPVVFDSNNALGYGGGVCVVSLQGDSCQYGGELQLYLSPKSSIIALRNTAQIGGGFLFYSCPLVANSASVQKLVSAEGAGAGNFPFFAMGGEFVYVNKNSAGYGPLGATTPMHLVLVGNSTLLNYFPGESLQSILSLQDG